jgi:hypothetical protein
MLDAELYSEDEPLPSDLTDSNDPEALEKRRLDAELPGPSVMEGDSAANSSPVHPPIPGSTAPANPGDASPHIPASAASLLSALGADDPSQAAALSMFGADFRSLGAHLMVHTTKLKGYLEAIKPSSDPLVRYSALQELNEDDEEHEDDHDEDDEDSALAAALAMSGASNFVGDENPEAQVLASRCLYNMMEALPGTAHTVVFHGAIPALCSKLLEIQFIDLAEQNISVSSVIFDSTFSLNMPF